MVEIENPLITGNVTSTLNGEREQRQPEIQP